MWKENNMSDTAIPDQELIKQNSIGLLSSFVINPRNLTLDILDKDEIIYLFLRAHHATNIPMAIITTGLILAPIPISLFFSMIEIRLIPLPISYINVLLLFYYLCIIGYIIIHFLHWTYNIFIITNKRIIDIDHEHTTYHNAATTKLQKIVETNYSQIGFIPSFLGFGDLHITTSGNQENLEAFNIPQPKRATDILNRLIDKTHSINDV
ncbi:MAG: hypothetical protein EXS44_03420 [Candidatus Levybacteria bacterium]|nr:hypothetical protein [Candidatus Levybacteria bacterium]